MIAEPIAAFQGEYRFLSNFYPAHFVLDDVAWVSVEHYYQAAKSSDPAFAELIRTARSPGVAKRLGRNAPLRSDWNDIRLDVMRRGVTAKFESYELRRMLLDTGDRPLIEGNTWNDTFWGVCRGKGENHLGRILMDVRYAARRCCSD